MMYGCSKCRTMGAAIFFVVGLLFLLRDLNVWNFFGLQWYTVVFLVWGFGGLCMNHCPDCRALTEKKTEMKRK